MTPDTGIKSSADETSRHREPFILPPKRRFNTNQPLTKKSDVQVPVPITSPLPEHQRMKRSGRTHQEWHSPIEPCPPAPKLPTAPSLHELFALFIQVCVRPGRFYNSSSDRVTHRFDDEQLPPDPLEKLGSEFCGTPTLHSLQDLRPHSHHHERFRRVPPHKTKFIGACVVAAGVLACTWQAFRPHSRSR